ncbi:CMRF35-like molecule 1 isoform X2 [Erythrolamprus reginae]
MSIIEGPSMLNVSVGETLYAKCQYSKGYHNYVKYWCKGSNWGTCKLVVMTDGKEEEERVDRTVIKDNWTQAEFTVRMENITKEDAGIYWCAIQKVGHDPKYEVNITVMKALPPTIKTSMGYFSTTSAFPTETEQRRSNGYPDLMLLLPVVLGLLVLILGGATLLMWKLKKKKATKISKGLLQSAVPPSSDQATDGTELTYTTVTPTPSFASKPQVFENEQKVDYASFRFSTLNDQPIYANT